MDIAKTAEVLQRLLALGLTVRSWPAQGGYVVKVTGGKGRSSRYRSCPDEGGGT
jgi:hypothetical protein